MAAEYGIKVLPPKYIRDNLEHLTNAELEIVVQADNRTVSKLLQLINAPKLTLRHAGRSIDDSAEQ